MSRKSNDQGRAFEYACLMTFYNEICQIRKVEIMKDGSFLAALGAWEKTDDAIKDFLDKSAKAAVSTIFDMEPMMIENADDCLTLKIQPDNEGEVGDVRDIVVQRISRGWEIGFSIKHNHFAVKHSRLSYCLDFCGEWINLPCSDEYWDEIRPIFHLLQEEKEKNTLFRNLPSKHSNIYVPILNAFINEIKRKCIDHPDVPSRLVEFLLGKFDFYKVISIDNKHIAQIQTYNLRGNLNKPSPKSKPKILVPIVSLPTRIVSLDFKLKSKTTVEMYLDKGWQFSFRIHNAKDICEPSLKFDIQLVGMPSSIIILNCRWMH